MECNSMQSKKPYHGLTCHESSQKKGAFENTNIGGALFSSGVDYIYFG